MPEGDSVYRAARRMAAGLVGRTVTTSDFRVTRHATADLNAAVRLAQRRMRHSLDRPGQVTTGDTRRGHTRSVYSRSRRA